MLFLIVVLIESHTLTKLKILKVDSGMEASTQQHVHLLTLTHAFQYKIETLAVFYPGYPMSAAQHHSTPSGNLMWSIFLTQREQMSV